MYTPIPSVNATFTPGYIFTPGPPDWFYCNARYGESLDQQSCFAAAEHIPGTDNDAAAVEWEYGGAGPFSFPFTSTVDGCTIQVDVPGSDKVSMYMFPPKIIRGLAKFLLTECLSDEHEYVGGFIVLGMKPLIDYINDPLMHNTNLNAAITPWKWNVDRPVFPPYLSFITITVLGPKGFTGQPGDYDYMTPQVLWVNQGKDGKLPPKATNLFYQSAKLMRRVMKEGRMPKPWWQYVFDLANNLATKFASAPAATVTLTATSNNVGVQPDLQPGDLIGDLPEGVSLSDVLGYVPGAHVVGDWRLAPGVEEVEVEGVVDLEDLEDIEEVE